MDRHDVVFFHKVFDQLQQDNTLDWGTSVGRATVGIKTSDIGDTNAVGVVSDGMGARFLNGSAQVDAPIRVDDIMIADVTPAKGSVVTPYCFDSTDCLESSGGAMDDDFSDFTHFYVVDMFYVDRGLWV